MSPLQRNRWEQLKSLFDELVDLDSEQRRKRLDAAGIHEPRLRIEIEALLAADDKTRSVIGRDAGGLAEHALHAEAGWPASHRTNFELLPGARVAGRYRIVSLLGRGGMGEVYRADDLKLGHSVALKFLPPALQHKPHYLERLLEETKLARQVSHPNVCRVYDIGEWDGQHFLAMEFIDGEDLASLIKRIGHLPRQKALDIARQLCAGLDASHQLGILHCDLKPSNVMLDGRGHVRITDFGLAVAMSGSVRDSGAGTPAYMAPEQLAGHAATVRSDVYALGLVLYELFTGRRAFQAGSLEDLRRLKDESSPVKPSDLIDGIEPSVERAILGCLEKDPGLRPPSARDVALLLPGGDPLAAVLAAGETPSPDIVAASGPTGAITASRATHLVALLGLTLVALVVLNDRASILGWVPLTRSAEALQDNARMIVDRLGYRTRPVDRVWGFSAWHPPYRQYVISTDSSATRWHTLRESGQLDVTFGYRQSPSYLAPRGSDGVAYLADDPPEPGDLRLGTDLRGRLFWLLVDSEEASPPPAASAAPDWRVLFELAGLDISKFSTVVPTRHPSVSADSWAAWSGKLPEFGNYPVRVEAAAFRGAPVFFELVVPWDHYWDPAVGPTRVPAVPVWYDVGAGLFIVFAFAAGGVLVVRNWMNGRGDRRGAFRTAAAVFCVRFLVWVLDAHHVPLVPAEARLLVMAVGKALADAAVTWCLYVALEPHARRLQPEIFVSWTRLLRGKWNDPLVGRDVLYGCLAALVAILFWAQLYTVLPHAASLSEPPQPLLNPMASPPYLYVLISPYLQPLLGGRHVAAAVLSSALNAFALAIVLSTFALGLLFVIRQRHVSTAVALLAVTLLGWPVGMSGLTPISVGCSLAGALALVWSLRRGVVQLISLLFCATLWTSFPITANTDAPHFGTGLLAVVIIVGLAAWGGFTAARVRALPARRAAA